MISNTLAHLEIQVQNPELPLLLLCSLVVFQALSGLERHLVDNPCTTHSLPCVAINPVNDFLIINVKPHRNDFEII